MNDVGKNDESAKGNFFIVGGGRNLSLHAAIGADEQSDKGTSKLGDGWGGDMMHPIVNEIQ
ncbi:MAG: hypothetical protein V3T23_14015 [Nitrososphaerales archaeon]